MLKDNYGIFVWLHRNKLPTPALIGMKWHAINLWCLILFCITVWLKSSLNTKCGVIDRWFIYCLLSQPFFNQRASLMEKSESKLTNWEGRTPVNTVQQTSTADLPHWPSGLKAYCLSPKLAPLFIFTYCNDSDHGSWFIHCSSICPGWAVAWLLGAPPV